MKVSIVMTYYNRRPQLIRTLRSIELTDHDDYEVVIVDDASDQGIEDLQTQFPIKLIRVDERGKYGYNPCVAFNMGFSAATGQVIVIQNAENMHYGDIVKYAADHVRRNDYILFACRSLPKEDTERLGGINWGNYITSVKKILTQGGQFYERFKRYNPILHWCSALSREALAELNGFDERYAWGNDWDDNELFWRISQCKKMDVTILDEDRPFVFHQDHSHALHTGKSGAHELYLKRHYINKNLYENVTKKEKGYGANPGKEIIRSITD